MKDIFEQGHFSAYSVRNLNESTAPILSHSEFASRKTTVFISHKHDDLDDLKGFWGFLEYCYNVKVYIDSQDPNMPKKTSKKTATNIKNRITKCDKFIMLATNGAIESKWCNWELGFGDAHKYKEHIALFLMKPSGSDDTSYKGSEYMSIYPHIVYYNGTEKYNTGRTIEKGYYVRTYNDDGTGCYITPLKDWFDKV